MRVAITGSTGLVGTALIPRLQDDGHEVLALVRRESKSDNEITWDPANGEIDSEALEGVDAVVHLAGENIAGGRWNDKMKERLVNSRGFQWRIAALAPDDVSGLFERLPTSSFDALARSLSGWDSWIERMEWSILVTEGDLLVGMLRVGKNEAASAIANRWTLRKDEPLVENLWAACAQDKDIRAAGSLVLVKAYGKLAEFEAASRRFAGGVSVLELIGDPVAWMESIREQFSLYSCVDILDWIDGEPESWSGFLAAFQRLSDEAGPDQGRLNAWILFAKKLIERMESAPETWHELLKALLRGWQQTLAQAKGAVSDHAHHSADREMARTLAGESSKVLCWLAA